MRPIVQPNDANKPNKKVGKRIEYAAGHQPRESSQEFTTIDYNKK